MTPPTPVVATAIPALIDADEIARLLGISKRHLQRLVHGGEFPRPLKIGGCSRWSTETYTAYVARLQAKQAGRRRHV
jgi:excisionase family DNA binding protein